MRSFKSTVVKNTLHLPWLFYDGMAFYPFIFLKNKKLKADKILLNHEHIHLQQQLELAVVFFYLIYFINYCVNLVVFKNHNKAYRNIVFEREAFANQKNMLYLQQRKRFAFLKYLD